MLIVFEGIDGSGKSTQANLLAEWLRSKGREVVLSKEPTTGPIGTLIRELAKSDKPRNKEEESRLFIEDRKNHVANVIQPALDRGADVILDRYYFSNIAYQASSFSEMKTLRDINESFAPKPDVSIFVQIPVELAEERISIRNGAPEIFENRHTLVGADLIFQVLSEEDPWYTVDGTLPVENLHKKIRKHVKSYVHR